MINKEIRNWYKGKITVKAVDVTYTPEITEFDYSNEALYEGNGLFIGTFQDNLGAWGIRDCIGADVSISDRKVYLKEPFSDVYFTVYSYVPEE